MRKAILCFVAVVCLGWPCFAQESDSLHALRGLNFGVSVNISGSPGDVPRGLSEASLQTAAELGLRRNGVPLNGAASGLVRFDVLIIHNQDRRLDFYVYTVSCRVQTGVKTYDNTLIVAVVWEDNSLGYGSSTVAAERIRESVTELTDRFSNDYLKVNPKK